MAHQIKNKAAKDGLIRFPFFPLTPSANYFFKYRERMRFSHAVCCAIGGSIVIPTEEGYYEGISTSNGSQTLMVFYERCLTNRKLVAKTEAIM